MTKKRQIDLPVGKRLEDIVVRAKLPWTMNVTPLNMCLVKERESGWEMV
jgi:hypothetical protein